ncbi:hypothetical protein NOJ05_19685 [Neorhizobium galegae]|uniref:hypothetical protein n=1 Tax=Neorhizobium galegae TaxID=399 RepID=UPI00210810C2|nr:hypothetical protein [Neorhizobium galegae]MCQ1779434.1 hypothetical protein [Neorhizobium galegae]MCQ1795594.1 hypothetical protein [Neorhizobium galegae]
MQLIFSDPEAALRDNMKGVFDDVGLRPFVGLGSAEAMNIEFRNEANDLQSAVTVRFYATVSDEGEPGWRLAGMDVDHFTRDQFARSGWTYDYDDNERDEHFFTEGAKEAFEIIEEAVRNAFVLKIGDTHEKHTSNYDFQKAWETVEEVVHSEFRGVRIACSRVEGCDSYSFSDPFGREWRLGFNGGWATLFCGEKELEGFGAHDLDKMWSVLKAHLSETFDFELGGGFAP